MNHRRTKSMSPDTHGVVGTINRQTLKVYDAGHIRVLADESKDNASDVEENVGNDSVGLDTLADTLVGMGVMTTRCSSTISQDQ